MQFVNLGKSGLKVSRICLGMMSYGSTQWREWVLDEASARPFVQRATPTHLLRTDRQRLLARKEAILTQILALEFDYETGKVPAELYQTQRQAMVAEAAVVLQELDALPPASQVDVEIEAAIAQLRGQTAVTPPPATAPTAPRGSRVIW